MIIERRILELDVNNNELNVGAPLCSPAERIIPILQKSETASCPGIGTSSRAFLCGGRRGSIEINGASFPSARAGGYINSNVLHSASVLCGSYCIYNALVFDPNFIAEACRQYRGPSGPPLMKCGIFHGFPLI